MCLPLPANLVDPDPVTGPGTVRSVTRRVVADEDYRAGLLAHGAPAPAADLLLGMFHASRWGEFAAVDPTLRACWGVRPPRCATC